MKHQPTKLALLISLIGAGVSPYACARSEMRVVRSPQSVPSPALEESAAWAAESLRWSAAGVTWTTAGNGAVEFSERHHAVLASDPHGDEWVPGVMQSAPRPLGPCAPPFNATDDPAPRLACGTQDRKEPDAEVADDASARPAGADDDDRTAPAAQAQHALNDPKPVDHGRRSRLRERVLGADPEQRAVDADEAEERVAGDAPSERSPVSASTNDVRAQSPQYMPTAMAQARAQSGESAHAERLLNSLTAIVMKDPAGADVDHTASIESSIELSPAAVGQACAPQSDSADCEAHTEPATAVRQAGEPCAERCEIVVLPQASQVLRSLEAILFNPRDEVGVATSSQVNEKVVATQADKVLATLAAVSASSNPSEQGMTRRERKLAALKLKARAAQEASAAEASASAGARAGGWTPADENPSVPAAEPDALQHAAPTAPDTVFKARHAAPLDIDLALPFIAESTPVVGIDIELPALPTIATLEPARERKVRPSPFGSELVAVSELALDGVRGGFVTDNLSISFGIERAVYINGALVTTTSLNLSDLGRLTAGRGTTVMDTGTLGLVQSGAGNSVSTGAFLASTIGTVVQNTLDGQKIQNVTVINATVNSLGILRGLNLQSSLRGAVIDSLRR